MKNWYINCETMDEVIATIAECEAKGWAYSTRTITAIGGKKLLKIEVTEN